MLAYAEMRENAFYNSKSIKFKNETAIYIGMVLVIEMFGAY